MKDNPLEAERREIVADLELDMYFRLNHLLTPEQREIVYQMNKQPVTKRGPSKEI